MLKLSLGFFKIFLDFLDFLDLLQRQNSDVRSDVVENGASERKFRCGTNRIKNDDFGQNLLGADEN